MPAPVIAALGTAVIYNGTANATQNVPVPSGVTSGAKIVVHSIFAWNTATLPTSASVTPPAGFTLGYGQSVADTSDGYSIWVGWYWKDATGNDTGNYTFTGATVGGQTAIGFAGRAFRLTGSTAVGTSPFIDTFKTTGASAIASNTAETFATFTPSQDNVLLVYGGQSFGSTTTTVTIPSGWTSDGQSSGSGAAKYCLAHVAQTTATATGALSFNMNGGDFHWSTIATIASAATATNYAASGTIAATSAASGNATRTPLNLAAAGTVASTSAVSGNATRTPLNLAAAGTVASTSAVSGDAIGGANLWPNPDFEVDVSPWIAQTGSNDPVRDTSKAHSGTASMHVVRGAGTGILYAQATAQSFLPAAGEYTFMAWMWVPSTTTGNQGFRIAGSGVPTTVTTFTSVRDAWTQILITFEWDGSGVVAIRPYGENADAEAWVDDIVLAPGNSGVVSALSGSSGSAILSRPASGTLAATSTTVGAVNSVHAASGAVAGVSALTGTPTAVHPVTGSVAGTSAVSGNATMLLGPLDQWRNACAAGKGTFVVIGDSVGEGNGASVKSKRFTEVLAAQLRTSWGFGTGGEGYVAGWVNIESGWVGEQWSGTGSHTLKGGFGTRTIQLASGNSRSRTCVGTSVDIWRMNSGGSLQVSVDGSLVTTIPAGSGSGMSRTNVSMGTNGSHTVQVTASGGTVQFCGATVYRGDESTGITYIDHAHGGFLAESFVDSISGIDEGAGSVTDPGGNPLYPDQMAAIEDVAPDLVIIELVGGNNILNGSGTQSASTIASKVQQQIDDLNAMAKPPSILILFPYRFSSGGTAWANVHTAVTAISEPNVSVYDLYTLWPQASPGGWWISDGIHLSDSGNQELADELTDLLAPLSVDYAASGTVAGTSAVSGAAGRNTTASGIVSTSTTASGTVNAARPATSQAAAVSTVVGVANAVHPVTGAVAATSTTSSTATAVHPITGTVAASSSTAGALAAAAFPVNGIVAGVSAFTGDVTNAVHSVTGSTAGISTVTGTPRGVHPVSGIAAPTSDVTGSANSVHPVSGAVSGATNLSGVVTAALPSSGTIAGTSSSSGSLLAVHPVGGVVSSTSTVAGNALPPGATGGSVAGISFTSGSVRLNTRVVGSAAAAGVITGAVTLQTKAAAFVPVATATSGTVRAVHSVTGSGNAASEVAGSPTAIHPVDGVTSGVSDAHGSLGATAWPVDGAVDAASGLLGSLRLNVRCDGVVSSSSEVLGDVRLRAAASGTVEAVSSVRVHVPQLRAGAFSIARIYRGTSVVHRIYAGDTLVYEA